MFPLLCRTIAWDIRTPYYVGNGDVSASIRAHPLRHSCSVRRVAPLTSGTSPYADTHAQAPSRLPCPFQGGPPGRPLPANLSPFFTVPASHAHRASTLPATRTTHTHTARHRRTQTPTHPHAPRTTRPTLSGTSSSRLADEAVSLPVWPLKLGCFPSPDQTRPGPEKAPPGPL